MKLKYLFLIIFFTGSSIKNLVANGDTLSPKNNELKQILDNAYKAIVANPDSAKEILNSADKLIETTNDKSLEALYFRYKGLIYHLKFDPNNALTYYFLSQQKYAAIPDSINANLILSSIGSCYMMMGEYLSAKKYLTEALQFAETKNDSITIANSCINLSYIHIDQKEHDIAEAQLLKALRYVKTDMQKGRLINNLGEIYLNQNNYTKALEHYRLALQTAYKANDKLIVSTILSNIGVLYMNSSQNDSAYFYFKKVVKLNPEHIDHYLLAQTYKHIASLEFDAGDKLEAKKNMEKSLAIAEQYSLKRVVAENYDWLSIWHKEHSNYRKAYEYKALATEINDSLFNEAKSRQIKELETIYQNKQKQSEIELLTEQNKASQLVLRSNRVIIISLSIGVILILTLSVLLFRQHKLKTSAKSLQLEHQLLRSQMNPHFIFNALGAIQNQVLQKPAIEATTYIASFAKLMRSTLNSSRDELISIESDIETLTEYLTLQKLRLKEKLQYQFNIDLPYSTDEIAIPPMLLQPFIENAVEHGIAKKDIPEGHINITFKTNNDMMTITIEDDGIGLNPNSEPTNPKHVSLASKITHERMLALTKAYKKEFNYSISNRINEDGTIAGVKVILEIPLLFCNK